MVSCIKIYVVKLNKNYDIEENSLFNKNLVDKSKFKVIFKLLNQFLPFRSSYYFLQDLCYEHHKKSKQHEECIDSKVRDRVNG